MKIILKTGLIKTNRPANRSKPATVTTNNCRIISAVMKTGNFFVSIISLAVLAHGFHRESILDPRKRIRVRIIQVDQSWVQLGHTDGGVIVSLNLQTLQFVVQILQLRL